ncbi:hypothetical protein EHO57_13885 [Leptospira langatensis]|uniref:Uncharacterized protein n=1 Tax=Leptospira langatensis TaxID=2484983 RepID=A0A5R2ASZ0_9LEPT|nr:hypothetical protein [Leptospira langatensis]TGJ99846.1 hypothetical protein EHO57_13885 [Leptospira langatensis]
MPTFLGPFTLDDYPEDNLLKKVNLAEAEIDFSSPAGSFNLGDILQTNSTVVQVLVRVTQAFDGLPSISVGDTVSQDSWLNEDGIDLSEVGVFLSMVLEKLLTVTQGRVYWDPGGSTVGSLKVFLLVTDP